MFSFYAVWTCVNLYPFWHKLGRGPEDHVRFCSLSRFILRGILLYIEFNVDVFQLTAERVLTMRFIDAQEAYTWIYPSGRATGHNCRERDYGQNGKVWYSNWESVNLHHYVYQFIANFIKDWYWCGRGWRCIRFWFHILGLFRSVVSNHWFTADLLKWPTFSWFVILLLAFLLGFIAVAKINRWSRKTFRPHNESDSDLETNRRFSKNLHFWQQGFNSITCYN